MNTKHTVWIAALLWAAIFLPGLGSTELKGEEWRRVLPGRTMIQTGNWTVPYSGGKVYSRKPPLVNWAAATSFLITGKQDEFSARLPCVLAMLLLALVTVWSLRSWLGAPGALAAAVFMLTNISILEKGRLAEIEPLYISFYGIAIITWVGLWQRNASAWLTWTLPGIALGVANLAKGPAPLLLFYYVPILCILTKAKRKRELFHPAHLVGIGLMLAVFLPWAIANMAATADQDTAAVWKDQIATRLGFSGMKITSWLLQPPQALANFLPWILLLPLLWIRRYREGALDGGNGRERALVDGLRLGLVVSFLLIALLPTSRPRFTLPLLVPASVLLAWILAGSQTWAAARPGRIWSGVLEYFGWILAIGVVGGAGFAVWKGAWWYLVTAAPGAIFGWWLWNKRREKGAPLWSRTLASGGLAAMAMSVFVLVAIPLMGERENIRPFGESVRKATGGRMLAVFKVGEKPFVFYLGEGTREIALFSELPDEVRAVFLPAARLDKERKNLEKKLGKPEEEIEFVYSRSGRKKDEGKYVLLNFAE